MRCIACDVLLHDHELDNRGPVTKELTGMCDFCQSMTEDTSVDNWGHLEGITSQEWEGSSSIGVEPDCDFEFDEQE